LEEQKTQVQKNLQSLREDKEPTSTLPESITLAEDMEVSFQPQMAPDFTQAFSDQFQNISAEKEKSFLLPDNATPSIVNRMFCQKLYAKFDKNKINEACRNQRELKLECTF